MVRYFERIKQNLKPLNGRLFSSGQLNSNGTENNHERMVKMNLMESICKFMQGIQHKAASNRIDHTEMHLAEAETEKFPESFNEEDSRDGMSLESAKLAIGRCGGNSDYKIHDIENKGRYFTAKIMDSKGKHVNELLVDKLNGSVRFLR